MAQKIPSYVIGVFIVLLPFLCGGQAVFNVERTICLSALLACALLLVYTLRVTSARKSGPEAMRIKITAADLCVAACAVAGVLNALFVARWRTDNILLYQWGSMLLFYVLFRIIRNGTAVFNAIVLSGVVQAAVAIGQWSGWIESNHHLFPVTGSFINPGPLGGYLAVSLIVAVCGVLSDENRSRRVKAVYWIACGVMFAAFVLADSRAAFVAFMVGVGVFLLPRLKHVKARKIWVAASVVVLLAAGVFLYQYRSGSAQARLLVWRVTADMIAQKPLFGHGAGTFAERYMLFQADYFERHPDSEFVMIANDVVYPYNEALHLLAEHGIVGLGIVVLLMVVLFSFKSTDPANRTLKAVMAGLIAFSMFSYPASVYPLLLYSAVFAGLMPNKEITTVAVRKFVPIAVILFVAAGILSCRELCFYSQIPLMTDTAFIDRHYEKLRPCERFTYRYEAWLQEHPDTQRSLRLIPAYDNYRLIGDCCRGEGQFAEAEYYYRRASLMVPNRIKANYSLWEMTLQQQDTAKAVLLAEKILHQPLKVENTYTICAKARVGEFLKTTDFRPNRGADYRISCP